jgi:uracil-DNA glycosylase
MTWADTLAGHVDAAKQYLDAMQRNGISYCPNHADVFRALRLTPLEETKVVILGQDPYHGKGQANGLAFAVNKGLPRPPSLRNIMKEVVNDLGIEVDPMATTLTGWAKQGVLLLNTGLTVKENAPGSHVTWWAPFTEQIIKSVSSKKTPVVFMLWGTHARSYKSLIGYNHFVLEANHPSPSAQGFIGCKHFSQANRILKDHGQQPIDWSHVDAEE